MHIRGDGSAFAKPNPMCQLGQCKRMSSRALWLMVEMPHSHWPCLLPLRLATAGLWSTWETGRYLPLMKTWRCQAGGKTLFKAFVKFGE